MPVPLCRLILTTGHRCRAVALKDSPFCYHHNRQQARHRRYRPNQTFHSRNSIYLAPLEDHESIQVALSQVVNALAVGQLDCSRGLALLRGLRFASNNLTALEQVSPNSASSPAPRSQADGLPPPAPRG